VRDTAAELMPGLAHLGWRLTQGSRAPEEGASGEELGGKVVSEGLTGENDAKRDWIGGAIHDTKAPRVWFVPAAVEYTFWEERQPELLMWFGDPLSIDAMLGKSKQEWSAALSQRLRQAQQALASASIARDESQFEILLGGSSGSFFIYDWWRKSISCLRGKKVSVAHGSKLNRTP